MGGPPTLYGYAVCECILASHVLVEIRLRAAGLVQRDLAGLITQGSYSMAVKDSAKTHAGGGVLDLRDFTPRRDQLDAILTSCGWLDFYRAPGDLGPGTVGHHHVVLYGCPHLDPSAARQVTDALAGRNGLANHGPDTGPLPIRTWWQAAASFIEEELTMGLAYPIAIRTTPAEGGKVYLLQPGKPPRHLNPTEWTYMQRLGAELKGGDFNQAEVWLIDAMIQPPAMTIDLASLAAKIVAGLPPAAGTPDAAQLAAQIVDHLGPLVDLAQRLES